METQCINTIPLDKLYISNVGGNDRKFQTAIKSIFDNKFKQGHVPADLYKQVGGSKELIRDNNHKVYEDKNYIYPDLVVCNSCKNKGSNENKKTANGAGIECYVSQTSKTVSLNIKVSCAVCNKKKNSYINKNTLPENIRKVIENKIKKI